MDGVSRDGRNDDAFREVAALKSLRLAHSRTTFHIPLFEGATCRHLRHDGQQKTASTKTKSFRPSDDDLGFRSYTAQRERTRRELLPSFKRVMRKVLGAPSYLYA